MKNQEIYHIKLINNLSNNLSTTYQTTYQSYYANTSTIHQFIMSPSWSKDNNQNEELPPTYEEALHTPSPGSSTSHHQQHQSSSQSYNRPSPQPHPSQNYSYTTSSAPPSTNPNLPFVYPKGYHCHKCNNTGYKIKNGLSCKDCWDNLSPRNSSKSVKQNFHPQYFGSTTFIPYTPPQPQQTYYHAPPPPPVSATPLRVPPGDPRLGGVLCGRCRGSGMTRFLLDMELCHVCNGLGRVVNIPTPSPMMQHHRPSPGPHHRPVHGHSRPSHSGFRPDVKRR
ncbi:hypothetical protein KGF54_000794 [Candida jiufengensis]|uniref:uncharacterized protein n=1 Tax=Candida jiufengensis TaxID=497108 RepID=UPI0022242955|nr:uncharacterized protein KGF54_000794 [Candida jiufengensis]KAI5956319.1 hypothetical protein KGF54_000794 [Candida jiufengensis]